MPEGRPGSHAKERPREVHPSGSVYGRLGETSRRGGRVSMPSTKMAEGQRGTLTCSPSTYGRGLRSHMTSECIFG